MMTYKQDILIFSNIDEIIPLKTILKFTEGKMNYSCTELQLFTQFFDRRSVHTEKGEEQANYWSEGARIMTAGIVC